MTRCRELTGLLFLLLALSAGTACAQSDDTAVPEPQPLGLAPLPPSDLQIHRHGSGGDDASVQTSLRSDPGDIPSIREQRSTGSGLQLNHSPLPGELAGSPEARAPLFAKPSNDLSIRPDPWEQPEQ